MSVEKQRDYERCSETDAAPPIVCTPEERALAMSENLVVELRLGSDGRASDWRHYLPTDSRVLEGFHDPVSILLKGGAIIPGQPPENSDCRMKVYVGEKPGWLDTDALTDAFTQLWPDALQSVAGLGGETVNLIYFGAPATHGELYSSWPYMPFGIGDEGRFFVSEVCKSSRTRSSAWGWFCVEYAYGDFKRMTSPDTFGYGTMIMGISVREAKVAEYLKLEFHDKDALERALGDNHLRCWWFCDTDFEGMTIWHKDVLGPDLLKRLQDALRTPARHLGLHLRDAGA
jgi:hypothetical protein